MKTVNNKTEKKTKKSFFSKIANQIENANAWGVFVMGSTFVLMFGSAYLAYILQSDFSDLHLERRSSLIGFIFMIVAAAFFVFKLSFFIYTFVRFLKYKAIPSVSDDELPTVTVIVPAYNEGKQVWATLKSLADSDYPEHKVQLLAIDDVKNMLGASRKVH